MFLTNNSLFLLFGYFSNGWFGILLFQLGYCTIALSVLCVRVLFFFCNGQKCITTFLIRPILIGDSVIGPQKIRCFLLLPNKNECIGFLSTQEQMQKREHCPRTRRVKSFLSQPHQFTAVLEFYRTEWVRLDAAQQGGGSCLFDVTNQSGEIAKSVFCKMVCVF